MYIKKLWDLVFSRNKPTLASKCLALHIENATAKANGIKLDK